MKALFPSIARTLLLCGAITGVSLATPLVAAAPGHSVTVVLSNMSFGRVPADLKVGDTVVWVNHDTVPHTVTARDRSFDLHVGPGQSASQSLDKPGTFPFFCIYHSMMRGTLKVAAAG
jgi:plastocyanin